MPLEWPNDNIATIHDILRTSKFNLVYKLISLDNLQEHVCSLVLTEDYCIDDDSNAICRLGDHSQTAGVQLYTAHRQKPLGLEQKPVVAPDGKTSTTHWNQNSMHLDGKMTTRVLQSARALQRKLNLLRLGRAQLSAADSSIHT